jgi:hypothetical protein
LELLLGEDCSCLDLLHQLRAELLVSRLLFSLFLSMIITLFGENVKPSGGLHWASTLLRLVGEAVWWIDGVTAGRDVVVLQAYVAPLLV